MIASNCLINELRNNFGNIFFEDIPCAVPEHNHRDNDNSFSFPAAARVSFIQTVYIIEEGEGTIEVCAGVTPTVGFPFHVNFTTEQDDDAGINRSSVFQ